MSRIVKDDEHFRGQAYIAGHRIRVSDIVVMSEFHGLSPDQIASELPTITLSDVHYALAYYFDNIDEIRTGMREEEEIADRFRATNESVLAAKLRARRLVS